MSQYHIPDEAEGHPQQVSGNYPRQTQTKRVALDVQWNMRHPQKFLYWVAKKISFYGASDPGNPLMIPQSPVVKAKTRARIHRKNRELGFTGR